MFEALPRWVWSTLAALAGLTLVLGATALIVSLPVLTRLAGSEHSLNRVNSIDAKVSTLVKELDALNLDTLNANTTPLAGSLRSVDSSVGSVDGRLRLTLAEVTRLRKELAPLIAQAPALAGILHQLTVLEDQLRSLAQLPVQLSKIDAHLGDVTANTEGIDRLPGQLAQLVAVLQEVEKHVANLDKKTGPTLP